MHASYIKYIKFVLKKYVVYSNVKYDSYSVNILLMKIFYLVSNHETTHWDEM